VTLHSRSLAAVIDPPMTAAPRITGGPRAATQEQRWILIQLIAGVVLVDQASKAWAWRHIYRTWVNAGGDVFSGKLIGSWYANPTSGAMLDVADSLALAVAAYVLSRRVRSGRSLLGGGLLIAGWMSNLLDRLGLHHWSAPGSLRGAIDYIPLPTDGFLMLPQTTFVNVSDVCIIGGASVLVLSTAASAVSGRAARATEPVCSPMSRRDVRRRHAGPLVLVGFAVIVACAAAGAADSGGTHRPTCPEDQLVACFSRR